MEPTQTTPSRVWPITAVVGIALAFLFGGLYAYTVLARPRVSTGASSVPVTPPIAQATSTCPVASSTPQLSTASSCFSAYQLRAPVSTSTWSRYTVRQTVLYRDGSMRTYAKPVFTFVKPAGTVISHTAHKPNTYVISLPGYASMPVTLTVHSANESVFQIGKYKTNIYDPVLHAWYERTGYTTTAPLTRCVSNVAGTTSAGFTVYVFEQSSEGSGKRDYLAIDDATQIIADFSIDTSVTGGIPKLFWSELETLVQSLHTVSMG